MTILIKNILFKIINMINIIILIVVLYNNLIRTLIILIYSCF